jgi:hypothetical protein
MSTSILPRCEQEIHLNMSADDPHTWHIYCDDPKWQRKFEKIGAKLVRVMRDGLGREYTLHTEQLLFRSGKRQLSDAERLRRSDRMRALRASE